MKIVHVVWIDSDFSGGWMNKSDFASFADNPPSQSDSVGFLAIDRDGYIVLAQSIGANQVADCVKIPRTAIVSIKPIGDVPIQLDVV